MTANRNAYLAASRSMGPGSRGAAGFTLIEVMIVVLIIGILSAMAYMSYDWAVVKTKRSAAAGCTMEAAQFMERYHTTRQSYVDADGDPPAWPGCSAETTDYNVVIDAADDTTFNITASPTGRQATKDTDCGILSVNQRGERSVSGDDSAEPDKCW